MATAKKAAAKPAAAATFESVMAELESMGTEQNRKLYPRHGAPLPLFGVSFANMGVLKKRIGTDHALARQLWATGNTDARTLAAMVADPALLGLDEAGRWARESRYKVLADLVAALVARTPHAREASDAWRASGDEWLERAGWTLVALLAREDPGTPDGWLAARIPEIRAGIAKAKNRIREAMNTALISVGGEREALRDRALAAAKAIGPVEVDHGETDCKTPDAASYIAKMWERKAGRGKARG